MELAVIALRIQVFCDVTLSRWVIAIRRFGGTYCLYSQG